MLIIHAGDSELVAVDCFECIDAQLDVREKLRQMAVVLYGILIVIITWLKVFEENGTQVGT